VPTANERKALWFLALVATSGTVVRLWRAPPGDPRASAAVALESQVHRVDSVRMSQRAGASTARGGRNRRDAVDSAATTLVPGTPVDLDRAAAPEIAALPGISRTVAMRIIANRDSLGPYGSLEALCWRVSGVGPATIRRLRPLVTFSAAQSPVSGECGEASKAARKGRRSARRQSR
jgi:DNA uptake protein ComE-like DNA-binding protein